MFSVELLKQKTNQQLRLLCKEQGIPQYGDKTTVVGRIMEHADHHEVPSDGGGYGDGDHVEKDADEVDYMKMKRDKLVLLKQPLILLLLSQLGLITWRTLTSHLNC